MTNLGYLIWFKRYGDKQKDRNKARRVVKNTIEELKQRQVVNVRTGISWAEWEDPEGQSFIQWYIEELKSAGFDILPTLTFMPPHLGIVKRINSPPADPFNYAIFVDDVCKKLGSCFAAVELWNEWNLETDWDATLDPEWQTFTNMIALGALMARHHNKRTVLGGMAGVRTQSQSIFNKLVRRGLMDYIDIIGFHCLRGTWSDYIPPLPLDEQAGIIRAEARNGPYEDLLNELHKFIMNSARRDPYGIGPAIHDQAAKAEYAARSRRYVYAPKVWVTEIGFPTLDTDKKHDREHLEKIQVALYASALELLQPKGGEDPKLERIYWYTLFDCVSPSVRFATTGWEDVLQHYFGDCAENGRKKLLGELLCQGGPAKVKLFADEHKLASLVSAASLHRRMPSDYVSQDAQAGQAAHPHQRLTV